MSKGAAYNELMENETKESVIELYLEALERIRAMEEENSKLRHELFDADQDFKKLEAEIVQWKTWGIIEIAVRNPNVASYMEHWEGRATKAEAENEKLKKALKQLIDAIHSKEEA